MLKPKSVEKGVTLVKEGEFCPFLFFLRRGSVRVLKKKTAMGTGTWDTAAAGGGGDADDGLPWTKKEGRLRGYHLHSRGSDTSSEGGNSDLEGDDDEDDAIKEDEWTRTSTVVATLQPGTSFGGMSLIFDQRRCSTVQTLTTCDFWVLHRHDLQGLLHGDEELRRAVQTQAAVLRTRWLTAQQHAVGATATAAAQSSHHGVHVTHGVQQLQQHYASGGTTSRNESPSMSMITPHPPPTTTTTPLPPTPAAAVTTIGTSGTPNKEEKNERTILQEALASLSIFAHLSTDALHQLGNAATAKVYPQRVLLSSASDICHAMIIIVRGTAVAQRHEEGTRVSRVRCRGHHGGRASYTAGQVLGAGCLLPHRWPLAVAAVTIVDAFELKASDIVRVLLRQRPLPTNPFILFQRQFHQHQSSEKG